MATKENALEKISSLVQRFDEQIEFYKKKDYNETQTRRDFIDPFWKALGWDVDNENGYAECYREVILEDRVKIGDATKSPDYSFRLPGGKRLFFLEAKKPSVAIKDDVHPAYQIRRYGWNAKMSISILTDFEEFAVYECNQKPKPTDKASTGRIEYFTYKEYIQKFDFIWDTFSKERVLKGSFDKYILNDRNKKGTTTVDKDFLESLDKWRIELARNIALRNKHLDEDILNFSVQNIIDRIIFLRIAEDRNAEPYGNLRNAISVGFYYENLLQRFDVADKKYNSGLFDSNKDPISADLAIDNKTIKSIISELYYPTCPFEFSVLPVEIIGSAYEQFLGKTISLSKSGRVTIEEKPEVRKAGGVYYTPQYIVDYIVNNTVGKLLENKTPKEVETIKIVDPACGSGSFLIGAYHYLLNWHKNFYTQNGKQRKGKKDSPLTPTGELTTEEKKRILTNNIFGVDIDSNAVEVTKLSLLLKCIEGETDETLTASLKLFHDRILPSLDNNIKSGNSLIDLDYYDCVIEFGEERKIKPFSWQKNFPEVFDQGGFDCVIGNPPYLGGREWKKENGNAYDYFLSKYIVAEYQFDIYALFWEAGIKLLNDKGIIGYITPNTWLNNLSNKKLRKHILDNTKISKIVDYSKIKVFDQATVLPIITILEKRSTKDGITEVFEPLNSSYTLTQSVNQGIWDDGDLFIININLSENDLILRNKIEENTEPLEKLALIKFGIKVYETGKGNPKQKATDAKGHIFEANNQIDKTYRRYLEGRDINTYRIDYTDRWLKYGDNLAAPRDPHLFEGERILVRRIVGNTLISAYTDGDYVTSQLLQIVKPFEQSDTKFLIGIINSKLLAFYFRKKYNRQDITFPEIRIYELSKLPIKKVDKTNQPLKDEIVKFVDLILCSHKELRNKTLAEKSEQLKHRIDHFQNKIDELVYQLYGLTEEEIRVIEKNNMY